MKQAQRGLQLKWVPLLILVGSIASFWIAPALGFALSSFEVVKKSSENQIRHLLEPLLDRYCHEYCRLVSVSTVVSPGSSQLFSPGFEEDIRNSSELTPESSVVKILIDDKVGPVSRTKLIELIQQFLDTLDYPVKIDAQTAHFPMPQGSETKITEIREKISKEFQGKVESLLREFCNSACLLGDFNLQTEVVNGEEAQYGALGEFIQEGGTTVRIKEISATILMDESLSPEEKSNLLEMLRLKTNAYRNVRLTAKNLRFPVARFSGSRGLASEANDPERKSEYKTDSRNESSSTSSSNNSRLEKTERIEKIERVENGDAVIQEMQKLRIPALLFALSVLALLIFISVSLLKKSNPSSSPYSRIYPLSPSENASANAPTIARSAPQDGGGSLSENVNPISQRYEIERLHEELTAIFAQSPRVAKQVFSKVLTEEGVEVTAEYIHLFGDGIIVEMLRDPTLQSDLMELMDYYAKNPITLKDEEKFNLLKKLHSRTTAGKLVVLGNRSSNFFDFLSEMDGTQILELIRAESITVKSIVLTQCDPQKRAAIYSQMEAEERMSVLTELSRIDYLPKDFIFNVAAALKRKKKENPRLNTEALPGSEVLVGLLERTGHAIQKSVLKSLELSNPDSARTVKSKLVSTDTLRYLRDGQLLEVVLSLKHEELIPFLKGAPQEVRHAIYSKAPKDLVAELEEEIAIAPVFSRETYQNVERKVLNRMKIMANEGLINLIETNERMFSDNPPDATVVTERSAG
ncbi:MAG: FliG C-terminal domain-containing protein [Bdellovibrionia bacterium]